MFLFSLSLRKEGDGGGVWEREELYRGGLTQGVS